QIAGRIVEECRRVIRETVQHKFLSVGAADVLGGNEKRRRDGRAEEIPPESFVLPPTVCERAAGLGGVVRGIGGGLEQDSANRKCCASQYPQDQPVACSAHASNLASRPRK